MKVEIITPERVVGVLEGDEVIVPTISGVIGILPGHIPLVAPLKAGEAIVKHGAESEHYAVYGGLVEVAEGTVRLLADTAEHSTEIDEAAVKLAIERAQDLKARAGDQREIDSAVAALEHNLARLKVSQRKRAHHSHPPTP